MNSGGRSLKILAVSDEVDARLYGNGSSVLDRTRPDLILGCGDLPAYYLDYLVSQFNTPMYAIHGNHDAAPGTSAADDFQKCGVTWIGNRTVRTPGGLILAGFDGCLRYNEGAYQQTQVQMQATVRRMMPWLWLNKLRYGRFLDVLITHAPPRGVHDQPDLCHTGFDALVWFLETFQPRYHLHGHIHKRDTGRTQVGSTDVMNVYPFRELEVDAPSDS
ncbi:MAG: metallophosphoesterase [Chloroflexi bacterium]|nr:metallophosphoesterase [Chloroflexota bacterium]MBV9544674.1 metallophosphoesterase [Chloroflexota bacterium]